MVYHIFSQINCYIKINGEYKGILSLTPLTLNLNGLDFIELLPQNNFCPIYFTLSNPPPQVKTHNTSFGVYLYPVYFLSQNLGYKELFFKEYENFNLKVVLDGICKIIITNNAGCFTETISFNPTNFSVFYKDNRYIGLLFNLDKQLFILLDHQNLKTIFYKLVDEIYLENGVIYAKIATPSTLCHTIIYTIEKGEITRQIVKEKEPFTLLNDTLFGFAFLESLSLKDEIGYFLQESINQEKLKEFIGEYDYILPCPNASYQFTLIGSSVKFVKFTIKEQKIVDLETS